jgi:hypothetical protein
VMGEKQRSDGRRRHDERSQYQPRGSCKGEEWYSQIMFLDDLNGTWPNEGREHLRGLARASPPFLPPTGCCAAFLKSGKARARTGMRGWCPER